MSKRGLWFLTAVLAGSLLTGCGGDSEFDFKPGSTVTPAAPLSGKVVQGPVAGAKICADLNANGACDDSEPFAITDASGNFTMDPRPDGDYMLISEGGVDTLTGDPALPMAAPKDAKNVTPLTTMVALSDDPEATKAMLDEISGGKGYDADLSDAAGAPAELVKITKAVEQTIKVLQDVGVTGTESQKQVLQTVSKKLTDAKKSGQTVDNTTLKTAIAESAKDVVTTQASTDFVIDAAAADSLAAVVGAAVDAVATTIDNSTSTDGTVVENTTLQQSVQTSTTTAVQQEETTQGVTITTLAKKVKLDVASVSVFGAAVAPLDTWDSAAPAPMTVTGSQVEALEVSVSAVNDFDVQKVYNDVKLTLSVDDQSSARELKFTLSGVTVTVSAAGAVTVDTAGSTLAVQATTRDATQITGSIGLDGTFQSVIVEGNSVTVDLVALQSQLQDQVAAELGQIDLPGTYGLVAGVVNAPANTRSLTLTVQ